MYVPTMYNIVMYSIIVVLFLFTIFTEKRSSTINWIVLIALFVFAVLRGNGDGDYFNYLKYSSYIVTKNDLFNNRFPMEFGFRLISFTVNYLGLNSQWIFFFLNGIAIFNISKIVKYKKLGFFSLLAYLYFFIQFDIHATRTGVALSFSLMSLLYYEEGNWWKSITNIILAYLFHKSSLVLLIFPVTDYLIKKFSFKSTAILMMTTIPLVTAINIPLFLLNIFGRIGLSSFSAQLQFYMRSERFGYSLSVFDPRVVIFMTIFLISIYVDYVDSKQIMSRRTIILYINVLLLFIFKDSTSLALRLSCYYSYPIILYGDELLKKIKSIRYKGRQSTVLQLCTLMIPAIFFVFTLVLQYQYVEYVFFN